MKINRSEMIFNLLGISHREKERFPTKSEIRFILILCKMV